MQFMPRTYLLFVSLHTASQTWLFDERDKWNLWTRTFYEAYWIQVVCWSNQLVPMFVPNFTRLATLLTCKPQKDQSSYLGRLNKFQTEVLKSLQHQLSSPKGTGNSEPEQALYAWSKSLWKASWGRLIAGTAWKRCKARSILVTFVK